jgi:aspartyl aminopeptidase
MNFTKKKTEERRTAAGRCVNNAYSSRFSIMFISTFALHLESETKVKSRYNRNTENKTREVAGVISATAEERETGLEEPQLPTRVSQAEKPTRTVRIFFCCCRC